MKKGLFLKTLGLRVGHLLQTPGQLPTFYLLIHSFMTASLVQPRLPGTLHVAKDDFELLVLLPPPPKCWDGGRAPPHLVYVVRGMEPRALCMSGERSAD